MTIDDIETIDSNLKTVKSIANKLEKLNEFISEINEKKKLDLYCGNSYLWLVETDMYEFIGSEILHVLEYKKTQFEKELYNYALVDLMSNIK